MAMMSPSAAAVRTCIVESPGKGVRVTVRRVYSELDPCEGRVRSRSLRTTFGRRILVSLGLVRAGYGVQHGVLARLLEVLERFASHGGVNVLIRHADRRAEFLQNEKDDAVANEGAPIEPSQHLFFFFG